MAFIIEDLVFQSYRGSVVAGAVFYAAVGPGARLKSNFSSKALNFWLVTMSPPRCFSTAEERTTRLPLSTVHPQERLLRWRDSIRWTFSRRRGAGSLVFLRFTEVVGDQVDHGDVVEGCRLQIAGFDADVFPSDFPAFLFFGVYGMDLEGDKPLWGHVVYDPGYRDAVQPGADAVSDALDSEMVPAACFECCFRCGVEVVGVEPSPAGFVVDAPDQALGEGSTSHW